MGQEAIAYQNKDITSKALTENFKGKTFQVYGLDFPKIREAKPTNIPAVKANELRIDHLFELEDDTVAVVDYESDYDRRDKVKYLNYLTGIANRYQKEKKDCPELRMIVIYTGDISRDQVTSEYHIGAVKLSTQAAFLSELDSDSIMGRLKDRVEKKELLTDEELMQCIILPLSYRKREEKEKRIRETVEMAAKIQDRAQQVFALAGILAFTDKVIDRETANRIRRAIEMTQVAMIFEEEKQQAVKQAVERTVEAERKRALDADKQVVGKMIERGYSTEEIVFLISSYSRSEVERLREQLQNEKECLNS